MRIEQVHEWYEHAQNWTELMQHDEYKRRQIDGALGLDSRNVYVIGTVKNRKTDKGFPVFVIVDGNAKATQVYIGIDNLANREGMQYEVLQSSDEWIIE